MPCVRDGQGLFVFIGGDGDGQLQVGVFYVRGAGLLETQLVQGIGCVGHELAQKHFPAGVERMSDDIEQLFDFRFEFEPNLRLKGKKGPPAREAAPKGLGLTARERQRTAAGRLPEGEGYRGGECFS